MVESDVVRCVRQQANEYLAGRSDLFDDRLACGWVREGHGDLRAANVFCLDDGPRILDCLDFDEAQRVGDVLLDLASLVLDLERLGAPALGELLLSAYDEFSGETHPRSLADHFIAYRAAARAKLACDRRADGDVDAADEAREYVDIAQRHLSQSRVRMALAAGPAGSGKTVLCDRLAAQLNWSVLSPGEERDHRSTMRTYYELLDRARVCLGRGESVVLDASWNDDGWRQVARDLATSVHSRIVEIDCTAGPDPAVLAAARRGDDRGLPRRDPARIDWPLKAALTSSAPARGRRRPR